MADQRAPERSERLIILEPGARPEAAVPVFAARLSTPVLRPGVVERTEILDRLRESSEQVVAIVAPPGYGKTTLLAQWAAVDPRPFTWLTLDRTTDDPAVLLTHLALAFDRIIDVEPAVFEGLATPSESVRAHALAALATSVARASTAFVVVIDDAHLLLDPEGLGILYTVMEHVPIGSQLALAGRTEPKLRLGRWRSEGRVLDIGIQDLQLGADEARALLGGAGLDLPEEALADVVERTEGWAAGLQFVVLARNTGAFPRSREDEFAGTDRFLADYFRSEVLNRLPEEDLRFLIRTSVLDAVCGSLCDAALDRTGSGAMLEANHASNLLVVRLDREGLWYRYHYLFKEMLRNELDRLEPDAAAGLAIRASRWCEEQGLIDEAVHYGQMADSVDRVETILLRHGIRLYMQGRMTTLEGWFSWLADHGSTDGAVAVLGAELLLQLGRAANAEQWAKVAEAAPQETIVPDGSTLEAWVLTLRAIMAVNSRMMQANADRALDLLAPRSQFVPMAATMRGIAIMMQGNLDEADRRFADAAELAIESRGVGIASTALAFRATIAIRHGRSGDAATLIGQAISLVRQAHLEDYSLSVLVNAVRAWTAADQGDAREATDALDAAEARLESLTSAFIVRSIQARLAMTHAYLGLGDARSAAGVLHEARDLLGSTSGFDDARTEVEELSAKVDSLRGTWVDTVHFTPAELRLFPLLATQLSYKEIADDLFLSIHTIKAEVTSIFRKLGVSSRTQAIDRAREVGLLPSARD